MDSKEATSSPIPVSSPEVINEFDNTPTTATSGSSSSKSGTSDEAGFESGQDEFDQASEKPVLSEPGTVEENSDDPVDATLGNPEVESSKDVLVNDDVENSNEVRVLESGEGVGVEVGEKLEESGGVGDVVGGSSSVVGDGGTERVEVDASDLKTTEVSGIVSESEVPVPSENGDGDDGVKIVSLGDVSVGPVSQNGEREVEERKVNGRQEDKEIEKVKVSEGEILATEPNDEQVAKKSEEGEPAETKDVSVGPVSQDGEREVEERKVNGVEEDKEMEKVEVSEGELLATEPNDEQVAENSEEGEPAETKLVEEHGVKLTSEGDSVVEAIKVEVPLSQPGVAVVGEVEESENLQSKGVVDSTSNGPSGVNGNFELSEVVAADAEVDDKTSMAALSDDIIDASESNSVMQKPIAAVAGDVKHTGQQNMEDSSEGSGGDTLKSVNTECKSEMESEQTVVSEPKENGTIKNIRIDREVAIVDAVSQSTDDVYQEGKFAVESSNIENGTAPVSGVDERVKSMVFSENETEPMGGANEQVKSTVFSEPHQIESAEAGSIVRELRILEAEDESNNQMDEEGDYEGSISDGENEGVIFGSSEAAKQFIEELERGSGGDTHSGAESSHENSKRIDGQIVTDSDEEVDTEEEGDGREMFDSATLAALLKAATGSESDGGNITISSQDGSRLFSVERPAGLGSSIRSLRPAPRPNRSNLFPPTTSLASSSELENSLSDEEKKKLEKLQSIRVKFLRLVQRLGLSIDESIAAQVLYRLALVAGRQSTQLFSMDAAKRTAAQLEAERKEDLDFSLNILVIGKCGVGKSATINSIFGENKATIDAFEPATAYVKEISGYVDGVKIRVFDMPGLRTSVMEQAFNRSVLSSVKKFTKKTPPDIVLYVDRLDAPTRDLNDLPLLKTITSSLGTSIWRSAIVTLTHAASAPPDGPSGSPLSYEVFVTQRSHVVQHSIGQAVGDLRLMSPSLMNPISLVENHPSCRKNREGQKILPNGQSWKPQLLLLCYSMKILSEANSLTKPQDPFDHRKLFGFRARSPPLPYMLSSMLQSRPHPKLSSEQGGDPGDSDVDLDDFSDVEQEEEDEYDQLPPFRPLKKAQLARLSSEQRKAYFEEYDYRVKLLQKKQWREELRRMKEIKKKGKDAALDYGYAEEDADSGAAAPVAVPLPDMALPPSFDSDNPAYRYRFLEPSSQFLARPVLDTHGWDHDCGYDGVNLEHNLAIASQFPATYTIQLTKDKKDFTFNLDSAISAKHGENGSSMAGFDIQSIGKQLAYIIRGETKFKNLKKNKTSGGVTITFLGENVIPGVKVEDQIVLGKQYVLTGSAGAVRSQNDTAYGANFELQRREQDYPIGQVQSTLSMSIIKWRGDLALGFNSLAQFSVGRSSKVAVRAGINNKLTGQITVRTSSSEHMSLALAAIVPTAVAIYRKLWPDVGEKYIY